MENKQPTDLLNAIELLIDDFLATAHHSLGRNLRNSWCLWWTPEGAQHYEKWPREAPTIVKDFNDKGIYHADDISSIILTSFHRHISGKPLLVGEQVAHYIEFWTKHGYENGDPRKQPK